MQEETKEETKKPQKDTDLPLLEVEPMFEGEKMLIHDEKGTRLDAGCCVALIASLILTVKDVYKFSESLSLCDDSAPPG